MARQRLGQHFLTDAGWREKIARAIGISRNSSNFSVPGEAKDFCWIEIGAGHGEMTQHLVATGRPVIAVELDPPLARRLGEMAEKVPNLTVYHQDVLKTDLRALGAGRRVRIYGNLPYYITSPILHHFFEFADLIDEIHIVIQLEVAFRLAARPGTRDYGYLSVLTKYFSKPTIVLKIPRGAFRPPPEVGSALVSLRLPGVKSEMQISNEERFLEFVKSCFAQKRKTLVNNLREISAPEKTKQSLEAVGVAPGARAEELSVKQLGELFARVISETA
ncbi:MAG TPA: 16S rRNA (adenine(1518)-N(6)/adenine(1519)-N(6))-dimethyltransferase RsmA [Candidatus Acidoferrum sp.]|nr:16S rRNA (adenine(1518)-N(6)/adenine(1519)-N(6))-dimethyltransferase RsmA [Candidatus Acidoferrum sp.]